MDAWRGIPGARLRDHLKNFESGGHRAACTRACRHRTGREGSLLLPVSRLRFWGFGHTLILLWLHAGFPGGTAHVGKESRKETTWASTSGDLLSTAQGRVQRQGFEVNSMCCSIPALTRQLTTVGSCSSDRLKHQAHTWCTCTHADTILTYIHTYVRTHIHTIKLKTKQTVQGWLGRVVYTFTSSIQEGRGRRSL